MSLFKKLGQVASNAATAINTKTNELKEVYEKEKWSGLLDRAEKNIGVISDNATDYFENIKRANEKVIHETAKNANSSFEAILKSTFAVSKETLTFITKDIKTQAIKLYKAWEDIEVEQNFSPELNLLYQATSVLPAEDLMAYCGATRDGAIYTMNGIQVEVYGEIWLPVQEDAKQNKGSLSLLQHVVVNSTKEAISDEFLLYNCLKVMYKIPEVKQEYERLYAEYLLQNPDVTPLDTPFDVREKEEPQENGESTNDLVSKVKEASAQYIKTGKEAVNNFASKYKGVSNSTIEESDAIADEAVDDLKQFAEKSGTLLETENPEVVRLREELRKAHAQLMELQNKPDVVDVVVPPLNPEAVKALHDNASTVVTKKTTTSKKKPATKDTAVKSVEKAPAVKKPATKKVASTSGESASKKKVSENEPAKPARKKATKKTESTEK